MNIHSDEIEFLKLTNNERNNYLKGKENEYFQARESEKLAKSTKDECEKEWLSRAGNGTKTCRKTISGQEIMYMSIGDVEFNKAFQEEEIIVSERLLGFLTDDSSKKVKMELSFVMKKI